MEQDYLTDKGPATRAGLFAAKEAVAKALGTGFNRFWPRDIEITHDPFGRPDAVLHGEAKKIFDALNGERFYLSITHNQSTAAAVAVLWGAIARE
jgi:holo-[acyl-carrier protein] synthase